GEAIPVVGGAAEPRGDRPQDVGPQRSRDRRRAARGMGGRDARAARLTRTSPYQGLVPYSEDDADWFFGRQGWREVIVDNLRAYRVSVLYGASGVGKSSVLNAGVVRHLHQHGREDGLLVMPFSAWSVVDPTAALKEAVG